MKRANLRNLRLTLADDGQDGDDDDENINHGVESAQCHHHTLNGSARRCLTLSTDITLLDHY